MVDNKKAARLLFMLPLGCRVFAKVQPASQWGWNEIFQNKIVYLLETLAWQNATPQDGKPGKLAEHNRNRPQLFRPDFMPAGAESGIKKDTVAADIDTIKELLSRPRG